MVYKEDIYDLLHAFENIEFQVSISDKLRSYKKKLISMMHADEDPEIVEGMKLADCEKLKQFIVELEEAACLAENIEDDLAWDLEKRMRSLKYQLYELDYKKVDDKYV